MVITCPNCEAKYKLPGDNLKGRGAKITCPRCSHVFVIFNQEYEGGDADAGAGPTARSEPVAAPPPAEPPPPPPPADEPPPAASRRVTPPGSGGLRAEDIFTSDLGGDPAPPAEGSRSSQDGTGMSRTVEPPSGKQRITRSSRDSMTVEPPSADLDFGSVGIETWKVKVAIGLIYDFSDIKTLLKSMREKKVTPEDRISHDGKDWTVIGGEPQLTEYFQKVYDERLAEMEARGEKPVPTPAKEDKPKPVSTPGGDGDKAKTAKPTAAPKPREGDRDAFKVDLKRPPRSRRRKVEQAPDRRILGMQPATLGIVVAVIVVAGVLITMFNPFGGGPVTGDAGGEATGMSEEEQQRLREEAARKIREDLERQRQEFQEQQPEDEVEFEEIPENDGRAYRRNPDGSFDDSGLEVVIPRDQVQPRDEPREEQVPEERTAAPEEPTAAATTDAGGEATVEETTAADWYMLGDMELSGGNCSGAIPQLSKAVSMEPGNATYQYKLGLAYHRCGQSSNALAPLNQAAPSVPDAQQLIDEIEGGGGE